MQNEKISIIIPVFNTQGYIRNCLDSVISQTYTNLEIICVDDGSTDESGQICESYAQTDNRVRVYHIENAGVSNARNIALSKVTGEWYSFIDSDDWINPSYIEILYKNAIENNCEISACDFQRDDTISTIEQDINFGNANNLIFDSTKKCIHSFICSTDSLYGMVWNKIYKTCKFKDIKFDTEVKVNEDCLYTYAIMKRCKRACLSSLRLYHWFIRNESSCHTKKIDADFTAANVFKLLYNDTLCYQDSEISHKLQLNYIHAVMKVLLYANYMSKEPEIKVAKKQCQLWKKDIWKLMHIKSKVKYYIALYVPYLFRLVNNK